MMAIRCGHEKGPPSATSPLGRSAAIRAGKLQFRESNMHGNPWFRLLRHEVETLVRDMEGQDHLHKKKLEKELAGLNTEARKLTTRLKAIERRRAELLKELDA